jgi:hypothetical protein
MTFRPVRYNVDLFDRICSAARYGANKKSILAADAKSAGSIT